MKKAHRCLLHARCMVIKTLLGKSTVGWHWQHILREFGCGEYSGKPTPIPIITNQQD